MDVIRVTKNTQASPKDKKDGMNDSGCVEGPSTSSQPRKSGGATQQQVDDLKESYRQLQMINKQVKGFTGVCGSFFIRRHSFV